MSHLTFSRSMAPYSFSVNVFHLIGLLGLISCLPSVSAFGSGSIPSAAYLKGKAWRHGDIEDTLEGLVKVAGKGGGAIVGAIASALLGSAAGSIGGGFKGGKKFTGLDVKRIYFGNWLRDLSQVCDIAGFKAMTPESLVICIMTMGFLSFGYATREFQVTKERLSVYLLTEHIDNPKGYAEGEDPRKYDPRLRPPVDEARELKIDERNGMKMYIASDDQGFDTSTACIRRVFRKCIELGRQAQREGNEEKEFESFRLLGTGLHTLEDFSAHSNWCELALQKLGHKEVFAHVGENVKVNSPEGPVPPLVTGTFAGADFCFSMLGEASDKLSSASIADLTAQLDTAQTENNKPGGISLDFIKSIMSNLPLGGNNSEVQHDLDSMDQKKTAFDLDGRIDQLTPEDLQTKIWELFKVRDNLMRRIEEIIQGIPGLGEMLENLSLSLAQWVMVTIDPFVRPVLLQASSAIGQSSQSVISGNDQWTVFNDPNASDPTHSVLAKDHFSNILNDPAGNISVIIVKYTVGLMVEAWSNEENPDRVIDRILEAIHHPNYASRHSKIQSEMLSYMHKWLNEMERDERELTIKSLTKDSIRNHRNQRKTSKSGVDPRLGGGAPSHGHSHPAYQQASMLGGLSFESQHGHTAQSGSAGYAYNSSAGGPPKSKHGDSRPQSQFSGHQTQEGEFTGSQSGTPLPHDNIRNTANHSRYGNAGEDSSPSHQFNQSNLRNEYRGNSGGHSQGDYVSSSHNQDPETYREKNGKAYESVAERRHQYSSTQGHQYDQTSHTGKKADSSYQPVADRRDAYSSTYGHQPEETSDSVAERKHQYSSTQGHQYNQTSHTGKKADSSYQPVADRRDAYISTYGHQPEETSDSVAERRHQYSSPHGHQYEQTAHTKKTTDGFYQPVAERRDAYSSNHGHQPEETSDSVAGRMHQYSSTQGHQYEQTAHTRKTADGSYQPVAERRDAYSSAYGHQSEEISDSQPFGSSTGYHNLPNSGYDYQSQGKNSYASHSSQTTTSSARRDDHNQVKSHDDYGQSRPSFPQVHAESIESSYGGQIDISTSDFPGSVYNSKHGSSQGDHQQTSRPTFPEAHYGNSQSSFGAGDASNVDSFRIGHDSEQDDYIPNASFPQHHHHDSRYDDESTHRNRFATNHPERYGNSAPDQGDEQQPECERQNQMNSDYGMNRLNMQDNYYRGN